MTLQLSACSFKCQNKPQDHSYKVPLLHSYKVPLLLPAAPRCLIFFPRLTPMHAPPGMPHFYMHAPPRGGLIFCRVSPPRMPPPGGMAHGATANAEASASGECQCRCRCLIFFRVSPPRMPPPWGGMASFATASGEASAVPHFFSVSHYHA